MIITLIVTLYAFCCVWGPVNQDEGWYLYAGRMVADGFYPYIDFGYTQGIVVPFVYSLISKVGLLGGRIFTSILGLASLFVTTRLLVNKKSRILVLCLLGLNLYHVYFTTLPKTYALASLFLVTSYLTKNKGLSGVLMGLACCCRMSLVGVLPFRDKRVTISAVIMMAVLLLPFVLHDPHNTWYWLIKYHTYREGSVLLKAGFLYRHVGAYALTYALLLLNPQTVLKDKMFRAFIAVTLIHILAPFPYDDYQVVVAPLLVVSVIRNIRFDVGIKSMTTIALVLCLSSPLIQEFGVKNRDRLWWEIRAQPELFDIKNIARQFRGIKELWTQNLGIAIEADCRVPHGMEMGVFSYFPDLNDDEARRLHVINSGKTTNTNKYIDDWTLSVRSPFCTKER